MRITFLILLMLFSMRPKGNQPAQTATERHDNEDSKCSHEKTVEWDHVILKWYKEVKTTVDRGPDGRTQDDD